MTTQILCNLKYLSPRFENIEQWEKNSNSIYIGNTRMIKRNCYNNRAHYFLPSIFANPYKVGPDGTYEEVTIKYQEYLRHRIETDISFKNALSLLFGKELGCWCQMDSCHSHVLLQIMYEVRENQCVNKKEKEKEQEQENKVRKNNSAHCCCSILSCFCCF